MDFPHPVCVLAQSPDIVVSVLEEMPDHHQELHPHLEIESEERMFEVEFEGQKNEVWKSHRNISAKGEEEGNDRKYGFVVAVVAFSWVGSHHSVFRASGSGFKIRLFFDLKELCGVPVIKPRLTACTTMCFVFSFPFYL